MLKQGLGMYDDIARHLRECDEKLRELLAERSAASIDIGKTPRKSWLGLCPATKISGGKVLSARTKRSANRVHQALKMVAMSLSHSDSALGAFYRRLCGRMDKPRANTATAHKLARMVYFRLTRGEAFVDQGQQRYEAQQRERSIAKRRAAALGFQVNPLQAAA